MEQALREGLALWRDIGIIWKIYNMVTCTTVCSVIGNFHMHLGKFLQCLMVNCSVYPGKLNSVHR